MFPPNTSTTNDRAPYKSILLATNGEMDLILSFEIQHILLFLPIKIQNFWFTFGNRKWGRFNNNLIFCESKFVTNCQVYYNSHTLKSAWNSSLTHVKVKVKVKIKNGSRHSIWEKRKAPWNFSKIESFNDFFSFLFFLCFFKWISCNKGTTIIQGTYLYWPKELHTTHFRNVERVFQVIFEAFSTYEIFGLEYYVWSTIIYVARAH